MSLTELTMPLFHVFHIGRELPGQGGEVAFWKKQLCASGCGMPGEEEKEYLWLCWKL